MRALCRQWRMASAWMTERRSSSLRAVAEACAIINGATVSLSSLLGWCITQSLPVYWSLLITYAYTHTNRRRLVVGRRWATGRPSHSNYTLARDSPSPPTTVEVCVLSYRHAKCVCRGVEPSSVYARISSCFLLTALLSGRSSVRPSFHSLHRTDRGYPNSPYWPSVVRGLIYLCFQPFVWVSFLLYV